MRPVVRRGANITVPLLVAIGVATAAWAATMVTAARRPAALKTFEAQSSEVALRCSVTPIRPMRNYSFRFSAGYEVLLPMRRFTGSGHGVAMLARVTPEGGQPVYLASRVRFPNIPP